MNMIDLLPAIPEIILLALICVVLVADVFIDDDRRIVTFWASIATLVITAWALIAVGPDARTELFDGSYVSDPLSQQAPHRLVRGE